jgi:glyoxylase-like metal-dependent hydrolase (beta-lactamase superfamily II)
MASWLTRSLATSLVLAGSVAHTSPGLQTSLERARAMLVKEELGDGVYVFRAPQDLEYWTATNSVVVVCDEEVVVFDSPTRAITARAVIEEIRRLTPKPVRVLINSHWHQDHWSGNDEYVKAFPGLRIVASDETRAYMSRMAPGFFVGSLEQVALPQKREELATAIRTGRLQDGSPLTAEGREKMEALIARREQFVAEVKALPRVLPNLAFHGEMTLWSGTRELRLMSVTGDATGSTVLYLPGSRILATGDVLVSPEDGHGPPPWTTNSYAITPWIESLRRLEALDTRVIVPGQGPAMRDEAYLRRTIELFSAVVDQVHAALTSGRYRLEDVQAAVDVDRIGREYDPGAALHEDFRPWVAILARKAMQEALDGAGVR